MVRWIEKKLYAANMYYISAAGLSTDDKPTSGIITGSTFIEVDTGKVYFFNEESSQWVEVGGGSSA